jgi:PPOX class probable F420-dependent enzyme
MPHLSRRDQIAMTPEGAAAFLAEERVVTCATHGRDGWPHLMPLWYVLRDGTLWAWTYGKSQKVRNLERDPRCTLQVEAGRDRYDQLRGVMLKAETVLHRDLETVLGVGVELAERYGGGGPLPEAARAAIEGQAAKRVALEFRETSRATWDHRKLGGTY